MPKIAAALWLGLVVVSTGGARGTPAVSRPATQSCATTQATGATDRGEKESSVLSDVLVLPKSLTGYSGDDFIALL